MSSYRLVTFDTGAGPRAGIVVDGRVRDLAEASGEPAYATVLGVLEDWEAAAPRLRAIAAQGGDAQGGTSLDAVRLLAPLPRPGTIFCAGANYTDHVAEMALAVGIPVDPDPHTLGLQAWHFMKNPRTVVAPGATVTLPRRSKKVDWEVELVAVIGRRAKDVTVADALGHVAFYTIGDDLSARDLHWRTGLPPASPFVHDWLAQKSFDGSCPLGPWLVPAEEIADPQALRLGLKLNGATRQDSSTREMIFTLAEQIAHLSERLTLWPGDIVMTGTPAGVGTPHNEFLKSGDVVTAWVEGIGELVTQIA